MAMPAMIKPTILGILSFLNNIGASRMMNSTMARMGTGLVNGKVISFNKKIICRVFAFSISCKAELLIQAVNLQILNCLRH